jgi:PAS domain S-box-containing protein
MARSVASWWDDRPLWGKGVAVVAAPLVIMLLIAAMFLSASQAADRQALAFERAALLDDATNELLIDVLSAESSIHNFLVTHDEAHLELYAESLPELSTDREQLRAMLEAEPEHVTQSRELDALVDLRLDQLELLVERDSLEGSHYQMLAGVQTMGNIRATVTDIEHTESAEVRVAEEQRAAAARRAKTAAILGMAIAVISGILGSVVFVRSISRRVHRNRENAERLVEGRELLEAPQGRDEVGRSGGALVMAARILADRDRRLSESEATQRRERELLQAILDQMGEGVVVCDGAGSYAIVNPAATRILGEQSTSDLADWPGPAALYFGEADATLDEENPLAAALSGRATDDVQILARATADGEDTYVSANGRPLLDADGSVRGGFVVFRDVTKARAQELRLEDYRHDLERSNEELERFAYVASHDLQEPLRMVASHVQLLAGDLEGTLGPEQEESMAFAVDGAKRMQQLINDLLTYSRVGRKGKPFVPSSMNEILQTALENLQVAVQERGATVTSADLPELNVDPGQLVQLLQNLIGNGIKFHGTEAPRVHVSAERGDSAWTITVEDNGIGVPPEHADRVFQIFQRLHSRSEYEGTGIGLAVCRRIVERHGGRIWVEPAELHGSRFRFTIPVTATDLAA